MSTSNVHKKARPKYIPLSIGQLPMAGKVSILHRISGVGLFLFLPFLLWLFTSSLESPHSYMNYQIVVAHPLAKLVLLGLLWAFSHHACAGIRFLLIDAHIGLEKEQAAKSAKMVLLASVVLTVLLGGKLLW